MKKSITLALALLGATAAMETLHAQSTIAQWDFESFNTTVGSTAFNQSTTSATGTTLNALAASTGIGSATGVHASSATAWSTPVGNGSANSLSANTWAVGDYYQFQLSTLGFENIDVKFDQNGSNTGPLNFKLSYSTDGTSFTDFSTYAVPNNSGSALVWTTGTALPASTLNFDLSSIDELANASTVYFRIVDTSSTSINAGTVGTAGTDRVDNFAVTGLAVPEPSSYALMLIVAGACVAMGRVRHRRS